MAQQQFKPGDQVLVPAVVQEVDQNGESIRIAWPEPVHDPNEGGARVRGRMLQVAPKQEPDNA